MISKDLIAASATPTILGILSRGESYGDAIIKEVHELSGGELGWTDGMLYPVLHRLEKKRLIRSQWKTSDSGRKRKYYRLTQAGKTVQADERKQWLSVHNTLKKLWLQWSRIYQ